MFLTSENTSDNTTSQASDYLGMISAIICLIHCLIGPILVGIGASSHGHVHEGEFASIFGHQLFDIAFLLIGLVAVYFSASHTHERWMKALLWISYGFLAATLMLGAYSVLFQYLSYGAALVLIAAHFMKLKQAAIRIPVKS